MKILIEAMHGLGDVVCTLPMIENVRIAYPQEDITVLVNSIGAKEIIENGNFRIDRIIVMHVHKDNKLKVLRKCWDMRRERYDIGISCANTPVKKAYVFMNIISPKRKVGIQFSEKRCLQTVGNKMHFVTANLEVLKELQIAPVIKKVRLIPNPSKVETIKNILGESNQKARIGVCIGSGDPSYRYKKLRMKPVYTKGWGIENISCLCERILSQNYSVILFGGKQELPLLEKIPEEIREKAISLVGQTSVSESIAAASVCDILIGVDTGMQHIAGALGIRTITIFGPSNPSISGAYSEKARFVEHKEKCKYCYGTPKLTRCKERKCLKGITVDDVFNVFTEMMEESSDKDGT